MIFSPHVYFSRIRCFITWVSNCRCSIWTRVELFSRVNPDISSDSCRPANLIRIRYVWTGKLLNPERKSCGFKNIRGYVQTRPSAYSLATKQKMNMLYFGDAILSIEYNSFMHWKHRGRWKIKYLLDFEVVKYNSFQKIMSQTLEDFPAYFAIFCDDRLVEKLVCNAPGMVHKTACSLQRLKGTTMIFTPYDLYWVKAFSLPSSKHENSTGTL